MKKAILFDLGGTLIQYFERDEFPNILRSAISNVKEYLRQKNLLFIPEESIWDRVMRENYENKNFRVRPLENRLIRIFGLDELIKPDSKEIIKICRQFMRPIFSIGKCYNDTKTVLKSLKSKKIKIAIVSNTPWGSPSVLWREEIKRRGIYDFFDVIVFCRDVGWRKPAKQIFEYTLQKMNLKPDDCIFVGDDPRWDIVGPRKIGMDAVLLNRKRKKYDSDNLGVDIINNLYDIEEIIL